MRPPRQLGQRNQAELLQSFRDNFRPGAGHVSRDQPRPGFELAGCITSNRLALVWSRLTWPALDESYRGKLLEQIQLGRFAK